MGLDDYKLVMLQEMSAAWDMARKSVTKAQKQQKRQHNKASKNASFMVGERVHASHEDRGAPQALLPLQRPLPSDSTPSEWSRDSAGGKTSDGVNPCRPQSAAALSHRDRRQPTPRAGGHTHGNLGVGVHAQRRPGAGEHTLRPP